VCSCGARDPSVLRTAPLSGGAIEIVLLALVLAAALALAAAALAVPASAAVWCEEYMLVFIPYIY
jgi:hypothetical protein